jgi:hypothetical protein
MPVPEHAPEPAAASGASEESPGSGSTFPEIAFASVEDFTSHLQRHGIGHVVMAWRDEYGPVPLSAERITYQHGRDITLLSYHHGTLLRCAGLVIGRQELRARLLALGLRIEERCRNLNAGLSARTTRATDA